MRTASLASLHQHLPLDPAQPAVSVCRHARVYTAPGTLSAERTTDLEVAMQGHDLAAARWVLEHVSYLNSGVVAALLEYSYQHTPNFTAEQEPCFQRENARAIRALIVSKWPIELELAESSNTLPPWFSPALQNDAWLARDRYLFELFGIEFAAPKLSPVLWALNQLLSVEDLLDTFIKPPFQCVHLDCSDLKCTAEELGDWLSQLPTWLKHRIVELSFGVLPADPGQCLIDCRRVRLLNMLSSPADFAAGERFLAQLPPILHAHMLTLALPDAWFAPEEHAAAAVAPMVEVSCFRGLRLIKTNPEIYLRLNRPSNLNSAVVLGLMDDMSWSDQADESDESAASTGSVA